MLPQLPAEQRNVESYHQERLGGQRADGFLYPSSCLFEGQGRHERQRNGPQRLTTLFEFMDDKFALHGSIEPSSSMVASHMTAPEKSFPSWSRSCRMPSRGTASQYNVWKITHIEKRSSCSLTLAAALLCPRSRRPSRSWATRIWPFSTSCSQEISLPRQSTSPRPKPSVKMIFCSRRCCYWIIGMRAASTRISQPPPAWPTLRAFAIPKQ